MAKAKKILIATESHEVLVIRMKGDRGFRGLCQKCAVEVEMLTVDETVSASDLSTIEVLELLKKGVVHHLETASGHVLICRKSLGAGTDG